MSRVFVATERSPGRKVVVKVLAPELAADVSGPRLTRAIRLTANLQHPQIVPALSSTEIVLALGTFSTPRGVGIGIRDRNVYRGRSSMLRDRFGPSWMLLHDVATASPR